MRGVESALRAVLIALGTIVLAGSLALAAIHADTLYAINQTSGAWLSFAYYAREGVLYPPLFEDGYYAGTRYFPGFFALHAALAKVTGEFLVSGKLLTYLSTAGILAGLWAALKLELKNGALAAAAAAALLSTFIGHKASMTIRGDVLPLALSVAALALLETSVAKDTLATRRLLGLAALAALPPLAKFTSFHALAAGALFLFLRDKKKGVLFGAAGFFVFVLGVALTQLASEGRFFESLAATAAAPESHGRTLAGALGAYAEYLKLDRGLLVLAPFAAAALVVNRKARSPWGIYLLLQASISLGFFFDTGAEYNHLIDLLAASIVLAGGLFASPRAPLRVAALAAFIGVHVHGLAVHHRAAWTAPERGVDVERYFAETLGLGAGTILAHDPSVAVLSGRRPVVADDFQYRVLVWRDRVPKDALPERIRRAEFDRIVLLNPPEPRPDDPEFSDLELGSEPARAIRERYVLDRRVDRFYVYRPR